MTSLVRTRLIGKDSEDLFQIENNKTQIDKNIYSRKIYKCDLCKCKYTQKFSLSQHVRRIHKKDTPYKCNVCSFEAVIKSELTQHLLRKHSISDKSFPCRYCNKVLKNPKDVCIHECSHTGNFFICNICKKRFVLKCSYRQHLKSHLKTKCKYCQRGFHNLDALEKHEARHLEQNNESKCEGKSLFSRNLHFIKKCDLCNQEINCPTELKLHVVKEHLQLFGIKSMDQNVLPMWNRAGECPICTRSVKTKSERFSHLLRHIGILIYKCHLCEYRTSWIKSVNIHLSSHSKVKREWKCETCKLVFKYRTHYTLHCKKHGEHTGLTLYLCEQCGEGCSSEKYLKKHTKRFHSTVEDEDEIYFCTTCKVKFKYFFNFQLHMKRVHQKSRAVWKFPSKSGVCKYNKHSPLLECQVCELEFGSVTLVEKHEKLNNMKRACFLCENVTLLQHGDFISYHLKENHLSECLKCDICDRIFACPQSYNKHLESHFFRNGETNYNLYYPSYDSEDEQMFLIEDEVNKPKRSSSTPILNFVCECGVCGLTFTSCKELIKHEASHKVLSLSPVSKVCPVKKLQRERIRKAWKKVKNIKVFIDPQGSAVVDFVVKGDSADAPKYLHPYFQLETPSDTSLLHSDNENTQSSSLQLSNETMQDVTVPDNSNIYPSTCNNSMSFTPPKMICQSDSLVQGVSSGQRKSSSADVVTSTSSAPFSPSYPENTGKYCVTLDSKQPSLKKEKDEIVWTKQTEPKDQVTSSINNKYKSSLSLIDKKSSIVPSNDISNVFKDKFSTQSSKEKEFNISVKAGVRKVKEIIEHRHGKKRVVIEDQGFFKYSVARS